MKNETSLHSLINNDQKTFDFEKEIGRESPGISPAKRMKRYSIPIKLKNPIKISMSRDSSINIGARPSSFEKKPSFSYLQKKELTATPNDEKQSRDDFKERIAFIGFKSSPHKKIGKPINPLSICSSNFMNNNGGPKEAPQHIGMNEYKNNKNGIDLTYSNILMNRRESLNQNKVKSSNQLTDKESELPTATGIVNKGFVLVKNVDLEEYDRGYKSAVLKRKKFKKSPLQMNRKLSRDVRIDVETFKLSQQNHNEPGLIRPILSATPKTKSSRLVRKRKGDQTPMRLGNAFPKEEPKPIFSASARKVQFSNRVFILEEYQ